MSQKTCQSQPSVRLWARLTHTAKSETDCNQLRQGKSCLAVLEMQTSKPVRRRRNRGFSVRRSKLTTTIRAHAFPVELVVPGLGCIVKFSTWFSIVPRVLDHLGTRIDRMSGALPQWQYVASLSATRRSRSFRHKGAPPQGSCCPMARP